MSTRARFVLTPVLAAAAAAALIVAGFWMHQRYQGTGRPSDSGNLFGAGPNHPKPGGSVNHSTPVQVGPAPDRRAPDGGGTSGNPGTAPAGTDPAPGPNGPVLRPDMLRVDYYTVSGTSLVLHYTTGVAACYGQLDRTSVVQGRHSVVVSLHHGAPTAAAGTPCIDIAMLDSVTVQLHQPLGNRTVLDAGFRHPQRVPANGAY